MSKLPAAHKFIDLSDYGRPIAKLIANSLKNSSITPIHITILFIISGIFAIICMFKNYMWGAAFFLIWKSILDAADGELARVKNTPSYTGRYLDSVADIILNFLFLLTIGYISATPILYVTLAFIGIQLQGTLYNYYYVILRNRFNGDTTSRVFEYEKPIAFPGEQQKNVDILFGLYNLFYRYFDKIIYLMDKKAVDSQWFPKWFMTIVSSMGLGSQLLIMSLMLVLNLVDYIIPVFITYSFFILVFIGIRRMFETRDLR